MELTLMTECRDSSRRHSTIPAEFLLEGEKFGEEPQQDKSPASTAAVQTSSNSTSTGADQDQYDCIPNSELTFNIAREQLTFLEKLGGGNFGTVTKALYKTSENVTVAVAVKMLRQEGDSICEREILHEAATMSHLRHPNVVRLLGVCRAASRVLLVMELVELGPLHKYLRQRGEPNCLPVENLLKLSLQVAQGMAYLESCKFVHRDLAARNVLLASPLLAKISDFGMSKALQRDHDYYRAAVAGRWPLKWYAPECIYFFKFDSKSDVWSFGITLWEVFSFGGRPYKDLKGTQILAMLDQGLRLTRPARCPDKVYELMLQCWRFEGLRRPTFAELVLAFSRLVAEVETTEIMSSSMTG